MGRQAAIVLYVLALVTVVVGVDVLFFRQHFWGRLMVNVGIVPVFAAFYVGSRRVHERSLCGNLLVEYCNGTALDSSRMLAARADASGACAPPGE